MRPIIFLFIFITICSTTVPHAKGTNVLEYARAQAVKKGAVLKPKEVTHGGFVFRIEQEMLEKDQELADLILKTGALGNEEKQYWFDAYISLDKRSKDKLFEILDKERKKLATLEKNHQSEISAIFREHLNILEEVKNAQQSEIPLYWAQKAELGGVSFVLKKDKGLGESAKDGMIPLEALIQSILSGKLSEADQDNLITYGRSVILHHHLYTKMYSRKAVADFIFHVDTLATKHKDMVFKEELIELLERKEIELSKPLEAQQVFFNYFFLKSQYSEALGIFKKVLDSQSPDTGSWRRRITDIPMIMLMSLKQENASQGNAVLKQFIELNFKDKESLNILIRKGNIEARLILLDMLQVLYPHFFDKQLRQLLNEYFKNNFYTSQYFGKDGDWYLRLSKQYFDGSIENQFNQYKAFILGHKKHGVALDGEILQSGVYTALHLYKQGAYSKAKNVLLMVKDYGSSPKSPANQYFEKEIALVLLKKVDHKLSMTSSIDELTKALEKLSQSQLIAWVAGSILVLTYWLAIWFPYWQIFRVKSAENLLFSRILLLPVAPLVIKRIRLYCDKIACPKIPFVPSISKLPKAEFMRRYIGISLNKSPEICIDKAVLEKITEHNVRSICFYGEGGMGKTLSAYKVAFELEKQGYLPFLLDAKMLNGAIDSTTISTFSGEYFGNNHIISILNKLGFSKYVIIVDNVVDEAVERILSALQGLYPDAVVLFTTRSKVAYQQTGYGVQLNAQSVDFVEFIKNSVEERTSSYRSFILEIRNILLISIIANNEIDITDIVRSDGDRQQLEYKVIGKYIEFQTQNICKKYLSDIKFNHAVYLLSKIFELLVKANVKSLKVAQYLVELGLLIKIDSYFAEVVELVYAKTAYKSKLQILDLVENSAILYIDPSHTVRFSHDLILEYLVIEYKENQLIELPQRA